MKKAVIILPTYNEAENVSTLIPAIFSQQSFSKNLKLYIVVVDDNSPDQTAAKVINLQKKYSALYLITGKKRGLGRAYIRGFKYAIEKIHPDVIFETDGDWSHSPKLIPEFIKRIDAGADFIIGSRYIPGGAIPAE